MGETLKTNEQPISIDWTKTRTYASLALLATFITAGAAGLTAISRSFWPERPAIQDQSAIQDQQREKAPSQARDNALQQMVCKEWSSATSGKRYNFVCNGADSIDVYEVTSQGNKKVGAGKFTSDRRVEVELMVQPNNKRAPLRRAHLNLTPSPDGKKLEGPMKGDDPREVGQLTFNTVQ